MTKDIHICRFCTKELRDIPDYKNNCSVLCKETVIKMLPELSTENCIKYLNYNQQAINRGKSFDLTLSQYWDIKNKPCHYCGNTNNNGIDRLDNSKGYTLKNSVPCCNTCNMMKNTMLEDDFIKKCARITEYNLRNRSNNQNYE
jgi:hypothetical protein